MATDNKGFSFKKLFFRDAGSEEVSAQQNTGNNTANTEIQNNSGGFIISNIQNQPLIEDFVQRLRNLIDQNNQNGFDFIEFTESLFEEKHAPDAEVFKTVFRIAQKMDHDLTAEKLLSSAGFYKNLVQTAADTEINKGITKRQELLAEKEAEKNNLSTAISETGSRIESLRKQILDLQQQVNSMNNELSAIDQKYSGQFNDYDEKINAIKNAKEQVILSIVDVEAGIKANLS
jgi:hypothetical protein